MPRAWSLIVLITVFGSFVLLACEGDYRPRAVGKEGEITVVMDSSHWTGPVGDTFRETVTPWINTLPQPERYFELRHLELTSESVYDDIRDLKNVVVVAPLSDSTNEADFLRRRLSDKARQAVLDGQTAVVSKPNLWRRSQRIYFVTAADADALIDALRSQGSEMQRTFEEVTYQRMEREMYDDARQFEVEDSLLQRHGFAVNVQHDFQVAIDTMTSSGGFVWLRRLLARTRRGFFIYYENDVRPSQITAEWIRNTRDSLTRKYMRGEISGFVRIDYRRPLTTDQTEFLDRYGFETRGLWYMAVPDDRGGFRPVGGGGPFVNYTFYDRATDRVFMLDGSVFAPDFDKLQLLRQMEVMARTFRTKAGAATADTSTVATAMQ